MIKHLRHELVGRNSYKDWIPPFHSTQFKKMMQTANVERDPSLVPAIHPSHLMHMARGDRLPKHGLLGCDCPNVTILGRYHHSDIYTV